MATMFDTFDSIKNSFHLSILMGAPSLVVEYGSIDFINEDKV